MGTRDPQKHWGKWGPSGENGDPTHRQFDPRTLEFSCSLEQFNAITLQFIVSYTLKKASCLHYYHSSIDLHDNLYARPPPACEKRFSQSRFQSSLACSVEKHEKSLGVIDPLSLLILLPHWCCSRIRSHNQCSLSSESISWLSIWCGYFNTVIDNLHRSI